jgi:cysteinyl-tRNA synthetase
MIRVLRALERKGMTYRKGGALYFRASSAPPGRDFPAAELLSDHAVADPAGMDTTEADNPLDFVLWKPSEAPAPSWPSPWGRGMPGWHIECFVMADRFLRLPMDLHGGGLDLVFPHHYAENLLCRAMTGRAFSSRYLHGAFVTRGEQKMSKSLGNLVLLSDALGDLSPGGLRWYLWSTGYRERLEYDPRRAREADRAWKETQRTFLRLVDGEGVVPAQRLAEVRQGVQARMAQDLDFGGALEHLAAAAAEVRARGRPGISRGERSAARKELHALSGLLGLPLLPRAPPRRVDRKRIR